jgi:ribosome-associated protein
LIKKIQAKKKSPAKSVAKPRVKKTAVKTVKKSAAKPVKKSAAKPVKKTAVKPAKIVDKSSPSLQLARELAELTLSKKATDVKILDLRGLTTITDFFVICTAYSDTQVKAVADAVMEGAKKAGEQVWHKEGMSQRSWVLLDYVDVVVHIFLKDIREFYGLEKLWGDAPFEDIAD